MGLLRSTVTATWTHSPVGTTPGVIHVEIGPVGVGCTKQQFARRTGEEPTELLVPLTRPFVDQWNRIDAGGCTYSQVTSEKSSSMLKSNGSMWGSFDGAETVAELGTVVDVARTCSSSHRRRMLHRCHG